MAWNRPNPTPPLAVASMSRSSLPATAISSSNTTPSPAIPPSLAAFPTPDDLRARYEAGKGIRLDASAARPLVTRYHLGEATRRYYQDAAIRAVLEKLARGEKRALLSLATGAGKTYIAVNLLRRIADAGQLTRALFVCDRDELRSQAATAFQNVFGADAAIVAQGKPQKNARILIATYQTLDVASDNADANFLLAHYPENYFSHIVIDECHRSAWGKWSQILTRNPAAVQIGLTATPRHIQITEATREAQGDAKITADNYRHFGEPVYEYDLSQGIDDGYLAACEIVRRDIFLDRKPESERESGLTQQDLWGKLLTDAITGEQLTLADARAQYIASTFESALLLPERVDAMCRDLFDYLRDTVGPDGPEQKTIIFCARDDHADRVATALNNLYADWCKRNGRRRVEPYAFKCTAASGGSDYLADLRGASRSHFIATTVDLLTTGVDVPAVRNVVFFKYVKSPISFYQMVGRGTRLDPASNKLMFRVYDYTNATRLFGEEFLSKLRPPKKERAEGADDAPLADDPRHPMVVAGIEVRVSDAGRYIVADVDGRAMPLTVEQYKEGLAARLVAECPTLDAFRARWIAPPDRRALLAALPGGDSSALLVRRLEGLDDCDLYDVLADLGYGLAPRTRTERADAFTYKSADWLTTLPPDAAATLKALAAQFAANGTDALENPHIFDTPDVVRAGGLTALKSIGRPAEVLRETKERMFAA